MYPGIFDSMVDGRPQRRRRLDPRPRNQPVDVLRRSVPPDGAGVSETQGLRNPCTPQSGSEISFLFGS